MTPFPGDLPNTAELLEQYWGRAPLALALRETHRVLALSKMLPERPKTERILDVGVGDGAWWNIIQQSGDRVYGIDIDDKELRLARKALPQVTNLDISSKGVKAQFEAKGWPSSYEGIIGNCSLEHVPDLDAALKNLFSLLAPGGWFVLFVPSPQWAMQGRLQTFLSAQAPRLSMTLSGAMNGFFQHWHLMDRPTWRVLLEGYGFKVQSIDTIGASRSEFLYRLALGPSFLPFIAKSMSGKFPPLLLPKRLKRKLIKQVANMIDEELADKSEGDSKAYEFAIRCTRS